MGSFTWTNTDEAMQAVPDSFNLYNPSYRGQQALLTPFHMADLLR